MIIIHVAIFSFGLAASFPELDSLQSKGVWAIRIQDANLAYVYFDRRAIGDACVTSEVAYTKSNKMHWHREEAGPTKRLAMNSCSRAIPDAFKFELSGDIDTSRLELALNRVLGEVPREPHYSKINGKDPFQISTSGNAISFSWMARSLQIYQLTWNPKDNSITASEYQEEVDSVEMN